MGKRTFEANLRITSLKLLKDVESFTELGTKVVKIREMFGFTSEVVIEEVYSLEVLERITGNRLPRWVIGLSAGKRIWVLDKSKWENQKMDLAQLILHEFVHIAINGTVKKKVPVWLNEGLAVYLSGQYEDYQLENSHIRTEMDFYQLAYESQNLYIIAGKVVTALADEYGAEILIQELLNSEEIETNRIFNNENLNRVVKNR
nr:hypothetical protein [uncultured Lachnoclostridium sp.]